MRNMIASIAGIALWISFSAVYASDVVVVPQENPKALKNPLCGFLDNEGTGATPVSTSHPYITMAHLYIGWSDLENNESDGIDKIRAYSETRFGTCPAKNIKVIPRVFFCFPQMNRCWYPADMPGGENDAKFPARVVRLIGRLGQVWNNDPRVAYVEVGICGSWGEAGCGQKYILDALVAAFPNKEICSADGRICWPEYEFGLQWLSFAHPAQMGQLDDVLRCQGGGVWKKHPIEGEVAYDWGGVEAVIGNNPTETMSNPTFYNRFLNCVWYGHANTEGWIANYTRNASTAAAEELCLKAMAYRYVIDQLKYPSSVAAGGSMTVSFTVRNLGATLLYYPWPVQVALLDKSTHEPVWRETFSSIDVRKWLGGSDWPKGTSDADWAVLAGKKYANPAPQYQESGTFTVPSSVPNGEYVLALAICDPDGGMLPSARFAINNYWQGGYHPMGIIGVGTEPASTSIDPGTFFTNGVDATLHYIYSVDNTPPSAPGNATAQALGADQILLSWSAATDAESAIKSYTVFRGTQKVGETGGLSYTDTGLAAKTAYTYQISATNIKGLEGPKSSQVSATTTGDIKPPTIVLASAAGNATQVRIVFSEPVEQASAQAAGNYAINNGITVSAASLGTDLKSVTLTVSTMTKGTTFTLTINNIKDQAQPPNTIAANSTAQFQFTDALTKIRYFPRAGLGSRMVGGVFEGANTNKDAGPYTAIYTIASQPADGQWTEATSFTNASVPYRYIRYRAAGYCNVAEIEFYRGSEKMTGTAFGTPGSWGNSGDDFTKAFDGNTSTAFDFVSETGGYTGLDIEGGATINWLVHERAGSAISMSVRGNRAICSGLPQGIPVSLTLYDLRGSIVLSSGTRTFHQGTIILSLSDSQGQALPAGRYLMCVRTGHVDAVRVVTVTEAR